jgi:DnaJ-class molecular chaperone
VATLDAATTHIIGSYTFTTMNSKSSDKSKHIPCPGCGGSGQTAYFGGESRFMLTWEDCPDCHGTGVLLREENPPPPDATNLPGN